jgi:hypothetical protein
MNMTTDTAPADDLVTEEMVEKAVAAMRVVGTEGAATEEDLYREEAAAAIRAVAPMIAARAFEQCRHIPGLEGKFAWRVGAREEREACAKIAEVMDADGLGCSGPAIAAAIRARGETP